MQQQVDSQPNPCVGLLHFVVCVFMPWKLSAVKQCIATTLRECTSHYFQANTCYVTLNDKRFRFRQSKAYFVRISPIRVYTPDGLVNCDVRRLTSFYCMCVHFVKTGHWSNVVLVLRFWESICRTIFKRILVTLNWTTKCADFDSRRHVSFVSRWALELWCVCWLSAFYCMCVQIAHCETMQY